MPCPVDGFKLLLEIFQVLLLNIDYGWSLHGHCLEILLL